MLSLTKKQVFLAVLTVAFLLVLITFFTVRARVPHPLQVSILGQTNDPSGAPMALLAVTNHTGHLRFFYVVAVVPTSNGWWTTHGKVLHPQSLTDRLAGHAECRVWLSAPEGAARWKFWCSSKPEVTKPERLWYLFVRQTGLRRVGFRDQPPESHVSTTEMNP